MRIVEIDKANAKSNSRTFRRPRIRPEPVSGSYEVPTSYTRSGRPGFDPLRILNSILSADVEFSKHVDEFSIKYRVTMNFELEIIIAL